MQFDYVNVYPILAIGALCTMSGAHAIHSLWKASLWKNEGRYQAILIAVLSVVLVSLMGVITMAWFFLIIVTLLEQAEFSVNVYEYAIYMVFGGILGICIFALEMSIQRESLKNIFDNGDDDTSDTSGVRDREH